MTWKRAAVSVMAIGLASMSGWACGGDEPEAAATPPDPTSRENASALKGAEAVKKRKCIDCHGENMAGATKALPGQPDERVELFPPNLTPDIATGLGDPLDPDPAKRGYTDELLARAIREGYDKNDQILCPQMKHFSDMTDFEVFSIVKHLRSLPAVSNAIPRSVCPPLKTKEEQNASK